MLSYYRTLFDISSKEDGLIGLPLLSDVEEVTRIWSHDWGFSEHHDILDTPQGSAGGSRGWTGNGSSLRLSGNTVEGQGHFWLRWHAGGGNDGSNFERYLGFRLATEGTSVQADVEVRVENREAGHFDREMRDVVATLLSRYRCSVLGADLSLTPERIEESEIESFWERLSAPDRCLPIVMVSEKRGSGEMPVEADELQQDLIGLANVVSCSDRVAWQLGWYSWKLLCYDGQVRVYAPQLGVEDDETRHRIWSFDEVSELGYDAFLQLLREECSRRIYYPEGRDALRVFSRVRERVRQRIYSESDRDKQQEIDEWVAEVAAKDAEIRRWQDSSQRFEEENRQLKSRVAHLESGIRTLQGRLSSDSSRLSAGYSVAEVWATEGERSSVRTVEDVMERVENWRYVRVFKVAAKDCGQLPADDARLFYEELRKLEDCGRERSAGNLGMSEEEWLRGKGIHFAAGEGQGTMNQYREERRFRDDNGAVVEMQAHIRVRELRIHLLWRDEESRWLVGYFGRHLRTATG